MSSNISDSANSSNYTFKVLRKSIILCVQENDAGGDIRRWRFDLAGNEEVADMLQSDHRCGGCRILPSNGYRSSKSGWCQFSRKIANLQESVARLDR